MKRSFITEIKGEEEAVLLKGWIYKIKKFKTFAFVSLRDKTGVVQLLLEDLDALENLKTEMAIEVMGVPVKNEKAEGGIEIHIKDLSIIGNVYYDLLPFSINQKKVNTSLEMELDHRYISLRRPDRRAIFKVQEEIVTAFRDYFKGQGFSEIHTPKIIASGTEGGSELFTVNYFDTRAFLAQSPQFYKQMMVGAGFESVFEIGHAYRAELHNTWRHLNEYVSLDVETGFIQDEEDLMNIQQQFIQHLFQHLKSSCEKELKMYALELPEIQEIPRIPLFEAQRILLEVYDKKSPVGNLDAEGEILFSKYVKEKYNSDFVFLTKYPAVKRPMYTMPDEVHEGMTKSFDLIYKGLEITTGGQRIHDYEMLKENIVKFGGNPEDFGFYVESFKYGMPPHGGFAMGLERLTMKILELQNIREATLLPRDMGRITP
ncbi:aspartate--tRNA(Asn) ligase [Clostridium formicaceticum]|uniref:Aspartate--tRNA ligase n=1 Tax=Clostridium formicaceticum TaxID=1497 RepID=A0AAC9RJF9_9CLOT|nr:aspartate--tRNA(Asn) ligase [Clostridium formicaceticum]AOY77623.1 aspartate--tRNA(Asn) ligase [Clostridium formicaceticum]ARE88204.1 Asparagine--tRNA ligase [Clostridium formicaceticum]